MIKRNHLRSGYIRRNIEQSVVPCACRRALQSARKISSVRI